MPSDRSIYRRPVWCNWRAGQTGELPVSVSTGQAWRNALANLRFWRRNGTLLAYSGSPDPVTNDDGDAECARLYCAVAGGARIEEGTAPRHVCVSEAIYRNTHYDSTVVDEYGNHLTAGTIGLSWAGPWDANGLDAQRVTQSGSVAAIPYARAIDRNGIVATVYMNGKLVVRTPPSTWGGNYDLLGSVGSIGAGANQFSSACYDIAVDGKYVYVADRGNNRISVWDYSSASALSAGSVATIAAADNVGCCVSPQSANGVGVLWVTTYATGVCTQFDLSTRAATGLTVTAQTPAYHIYDTGQGTLIVSSTIGAVTFRCKDYAGTTLWSWTPTTGNGRDQVYANGWRQMRGDALQRWYYTDDSNNRVVCRDFQFTSPWAYPRWVSTYALSERNRAIGMPPVGGYWSVCPRDSHESVLDPTMGRTTQPIEFSIDPGAELAAPVPADTDWSHDERHHTRDIVPKPGGSRRLEYHAPTDDTVVLGCVEWRRRINSAITISTAAHDLPASETSTDYDDEIESPSVLPGGLIKMTSDSMGGLILRIGAGSTVTVNRPATAELDTRRIWQVGHPTGITRTGAGRVAVFGSGTVNDPHWRHKIRPRALTATTATTTVVQPFVVILYATANDVIYCSSKTAGDSAAVTLGSAVTVPTLVPLADTLNVDGGGDELVWEWNVAAYTIVATFGAYEIPAW